MTEKNNAKTWTQNRLIAKQRNEDSYAPERYMSLGDTNIVHGRINLGHSHTLR